MSTDTTPSTSDRTAAKATKKHGRYDKYQVKREAAGRWPEIFSALAGFQIDSSAQRSHGPCPKCGGTDRFRAIDLDSGALYCNQCFSSKNGDGLAAIRWLLSCDFPTSLRLVGGYLGVQPSQNGGHAKASAKKKSSNGQAAKPKRFGTARGVVLHYTDALSKAHGRGVRLAKAWTYDTFSVLRFDLPTPDGEKQEKTFRPVHQVPLGSNGGMGWQTGCPPGPRPLYRRAELEAANDHSLAVVCAGEKAVDAAASLGLVATTNAGGEKAVKQTDWAPVLRFATVALVVDNDAAGEKYGQLVAAALLKLKPELTIKIMRLPDLPPKGDIVEWIQAGGTCEAFLALVEAAEIVTAEQVAEASKREAISNATVVEVDDKLQVIPKPMEEVIETIVQHTDGWPRRVGNSLFVDDGAGGVRWFDRASSLFGWLGSRTGVIDWRRGVGCVTKEELFAELQGVARQYEAIQELPHEPRIDNHYYACTFPEAGDGSHLAGLLDFFKLATPIDVQLLTAAFATPGWGGPVGARPAFMFTAKAGRGKGKSKLAGFFADLWGGCVDVSPNEDAGKIKTRLLTTAALPLRVALLDNVKTTRFSWGELEALITCGTISGHRMYEGEASRPNLLTWAVTLNGASLSTDMAQRVIEIQLAEPDYAGGWEEDVRAFIRDNQNKIIGDLIAFLRRPAKPLKRRTRWATWEASVLSRVANPDECLDLIVQRRRAVDVEEEEGAILEDYFASKLQWLEYDVDRDDVFIPNDLAAEWYIAATGDRHIKTAGMTRAVKQMFDEGRLSHIVPARLGGSKGGARGLRWIGEHATAADTTHTDVRVRIAQRGGER